MRSLCCITLGFAVGAAAVTFDGKISLDSAPLAEQIRLQASMVLDEQGNIIWQREGGISGLPPICQGDIAFDAGQMDPVTDGPVGGTCIPSGAGNRYFYQADGDTTMAGIQDVYNANIWVEDFRYDAQYNGDPVGQIDIGVLWWPVTPQPFFLLVSIFDTYDFDCVGFADSGLALFNNNAVGPRWPATGHARTWVFQTAAPLGSPAMPAYYLFNLDLCDVMPEMLLPNDGGGAYQIILATQLMTNSMMQVTGWVGADFPRSVAHAYGAAHRATPKYMVWGFRDDGGMPNGLARPGQPDTANPPDEMRVWVNDTSLGTQPVDWDLANECFAHFTLIDGCSFVNTEAMTSISVKGVADPCVGFVRGDTDCDGSVNNFDIDHFVLLLTNPAQWAAENPACAGGELCLADLDCDGFVNNFDIDPFVLCLVAVPQPSEPCVCGGADCTVTISGPRCLCVDARKTLTAVGSPPGGTCTWSIVAGANQAAILPNGCSCDVQGIMRSAVCQEVTIRVTYAVSGVSCEATHRMTVFHVEPFPRYGNTETWRATNGVARVVQAGHPRLGSVSPGNPVDCAGYFKNIEIEGEIRPCGPCIHDCTYDFKREKRGRSGTIAANGVFTPNGLDAPDWRDDDATNVDEDLIPDAPPACTIFSIDSVGFIVGPCNAGGTGVVVLNCKNFREWVEVDDMMRCMQDVNWHASTRIVCNGTSWVPDPRGSGNDAVGLGHIDCSNGLPPPLWSPPYELALARGLLESDSIGDRLQSQNMIYEAYESGQLEGDTRALTDTLVELACIVEPPDQQQIWSTPMLAIRLLGMLEAPEAIELLIRRVADDFPRPIISDIDSRVMVAAQALAQIGQAAVDPILDRCADASDADWRQLHAALRLMADRDGVRRAVQTRLGLNTDYRASKRLLDLLRS